ncbi:MAG: hypothetical protein WED59_03040 [Candidatus Woykebacteria bacterium]
MKFQLIIKKLKKSGLARLVRRFRSAFYRFIYSDPFYLAPLYKKKTKFLSDGELPTFFGYHDKTPFNSSNDKLLAVSVDCDDRDPTAEGDMMNIGYFEIGNNEVKKKFHKIGTTITWCWQQGCMLQWNPIQAEREIFYNAMVADRYGLIQKDILTGEIVKSYAEPMYAISPLGNEYLTLNFDRLGRLRPGYGYTHFQDVTLGQKAPPSDGLFIYDMRKDKKELVISLSALAEDVESIAGDEHYINHATYSPDGKKIAFFHLWSQPNDKGRQLRFLLYDKITKKLQVVEDYRIVSHYCWKNSKEIIATTRESSGKWHYTLYNFSDGSKKDLNIPLDRDGHPMLSPVDQDILITDTYPDKRNDQHLCKVNINTGEVIELDTFYSPFKYMGQVRCDLHPRWDRNGTLVSVDSTENDIRKLGIVYL